MDTTPRITTVSLNSAVDQTVTAPRFALDAVNRAEAVRSDAGGKGINVASFLAHFGHSVTVTGLLGRENEALFADHFQAAGVHDACLRLDGATRTNVKIVDPVDNTVTDLNFSGMPVSTGDIDTVAGRLQAALDRGLDWVALCGSLPADIPANTYCELTGIARQGGARVALDTSGTPLALALAAQPDIIKPNIAELSDLLGRPLEGTAEVLAAAREIVARGVGLVVVSMGADGAAFVSATEAVHAIGPTPEIASTVGAGDAMVAGLIHASMQGLALTETAALATAFSLGALGEIGPHLPSIEKIETFAEAVQVTALESN